MKKILLILLELIATDIRHVTGERASVSGIFRSKKEYIPLSKSETFPPLGDGVWHLVCKL